MVESPSNRSSSSSVPIAICCFSTLRACITGEALDAGTDPGGASDGSTHDRWFSEQLLDNFSPLDRSALRAGIRKTMDIVLLTATSLRVHSFVVASLVVLTFVAEPNATTRFQSPFFSGSGFGSTSPKLFWPPDGVPECLFLLSPLLVVLARRWRSGPRRGGDLSCHRGGAELGGFFATRVIRLQTTFNSWAGRLSADGSESDPAEDSEDDPSDWPVSALDSRALTSSASISMSKAFTSRPWKAAA
mmetsp:Transcript_39829/g.104253  ORF Transcript_39829/g.104253 Transcript_39829/m.104253 type:complete len:246 (-) Transcript_39829:2085-2822(-)